jgi:chromosome segregation ATPase
VELDAHRIAAKASATALQESQNLHAETVADLTSSRDALAQDLVKAQEEAEKAVAEAATAKEQAEAGRIRGESDAARLQTEIDTYRDEVGKLKAEMVSLREAVQEAQEQRDKAVVEAEKWSAKKAGDVSAVKLMNDRIKQVNFVGTVVVVANHHA